MNVSGPLQWAHCYLVPRLAAARYYIVQGQGQRALGIQMV